MYRGTWRKGLSSAWLFGLLLVLPRTAFLGVPELIFSDGFENHDPVVTSSPVTTAEVGIPYSYDVDATDVDGDTLLYLLTTAPAGMNIDSNSGLIGWIPSSIGDFQVTVDVSDGQGGSDSQDWTIAVAAGPPDSDGDGLADVTEATLGTDPNDPDSDDDGVGDGDEVNLEDTDPLQFDTDSDGFGDGSELAFGTDPLDGDDYPELPPDPASVAPELDAGQAGNMLDDTAFLYTGENPIQSGVAPATIELLRAALLRGKVITRAGLPLPGATVSILNHPELGSTLSRADGMYDLVVNGGGPLTVDVEAPGYLPAQRTVVVPWQDHVVAPDVALIPLDPVATIIDLEAPGEMKVARGSKVSDEDGSRQATVLFPEGVSAELRMPDGTTLPISDLTVRATEYTLGDTGPEAMPGLLPPTSGYTYAVEFSVDQALAQGAVSVDFDTPIPTYVENFLDFPAGTPVPAGWYDRAKAAWVPAPDGIVIRILSETGGLADLDVDGDDVADTGTELTGLGITDPERQQIANQYDPPQSLWRVAVAHFSPWDKNWPFGPPADATFPSVDAPKNAELEDGQCLVDGSIIECQNQVLGESVAIAGTPYTLNYRSNRVPGYIAPRHVDLPLTGPATPASLKGVTLDIRIAGQQHTLEFSPQNNLVAPFTWDGNDVFGRRINRPLQAEVRVGFVYDGSYTFGGNSPASFGQPGEFTIDGSRTREEITLAQNLKVPFGNFEPIGIGLGGWSLDVHHVYDPVNRTLYRGDGSRRSAANMAYVMKIFAGKVGANGLPVSCNYLFSFPCGDGGRATEAGFSDSMNGLAFGPDGSLYVADEGNGRVRRIQPDGIIETVAGNGQNWDVGDPIGDGGPAVLANVGAPHAVTVGPDGSVYIAHQLVDPGVFAEARVRKVAPDGIITTFAGGGDIHPAIGPAAEIALVEARDLEVDTAGNLYIADGCHILRVDTKGQATVIAGHLDSCGPYTGDGGPATQANLQANGLALGPDGSIYFVNLVGGGSCGIVRRIGTDGIIETVAGHPDCDYESEPPGLSVPALEARLRIRDIAVAPDGGIFLPDGGRSDGYGRLRHLDPFGIIRTIAGKGEFGDGAGLNGPATSAYLQPFRVAIGPDGAFYLNHRQTSVAVVQPAIPGLSPDQIALPEEDGSVIYLFDGGRHLETRHALTGEALFVLGYDADGRLATVTDTDGKITTIERDGGGHPTAIVGPFGQTTALAVDANGYLANIANPASEELVINSTSGGLIVGTSDSRGRSSTYSYDALGRLTSHSDSTGFSQTLTRTSIPDGFQVERTTALGRTTQYSVDSVHPRVQHTSKSSPDGSESSSAHDRGSDERLLISATGMTTSITRGPDPRFGMEAPLPRTQVHTVPDGGPVTEASRTRTVALADANDPLSLVTLTEELTIADRTAESVYTYSTRTFVDTSPEGRVTTSVIDEQGRVVSYQYGGMAPSSFSYNALGQLTAITVGTGPAARETSFTYGTDGFRASITDALGRTAELERDAAGRIISKTLPGNVEIEFSRNAAGDIDGLIPPGQPEHAFTYTADGRLASITPPALPGSGPTTFSYNADRQFTAINRPGNESLEFDYDAEGRIQTIDLLEGGLTSASYSYDYGVGDQVNMITGPGAQTVSYTYQGDLRTSESWGGIVQGSISWARDDALRVVNETVAGGISITFAYDNDDLLIGAGDFAITRNAASGLGESASLGVVADSFSYNGFGELTNRTVQANAVTLYQVALTLDDIGRIVQKVETVEGVTDTYDYEYDPRGELTEVQKNSVVVESYSYDDNGNRLSATLGGITANGSYDDQDRLVSYGGNTYAYTGAGRLAVRTAPGDLETLYDYDPVGNLRGVELPDGTVVTYGLDGPDRRVQRAVDGTITQRFLYDGILPVAELDEFNNVVSQFVYAGGAVPTYLIRGGTEYRIITDPIGSVRLVVNATTGAIAQRIDYDSFGNVLNDTNPGFQPFGFAGGIYDPTTGLVLFGARDYDAETGRFTAKDPTGFGGNDTSLYRYANNNPVNNADPGGTDGWDKAFGLLAGINEGVQTLINPALATQLAVESIASNYFGVEFPGDPYPGMVYHPPAGVDAQDYLDYHFFGSCAVDLATLPIGAAAKLPQLGALAGKAGKAAGKLDKLTNLASDLGKLAGKAWDEAGKLGKKALEQVMTTDDAPATAVRASKKAGAEAVTAKGLRSAARR